VSSVGQLQCWIEFDHPWQWQVYMVLVSVTLFFIPALIITFCYAVIVITIWSKSKMLIGKKKRPNRNGNHAGELNILSSVRIFHLVVSAN